MAVTGFDFPFPSIKHNYELSSSRVMDKQSFDLNKHAIDLNKHAIDLNEVPSSEAAADLPESSCSLNLGNSILHPRKGGWLELFRKMFGHDNSPLDSLPFASCTSMLNSRFINHMSEADGIVQKETTRSLDFPRVNVGWQTHDVHDGLASKSEADGISQKNAPGLLASLCLDVGWKTGDVHNGMASVDPAKANSVRSIKLFTSADCNYTNTLTSIPPFFHTDMSGSHVKNDSFISSVQSKCVNGILPSFGSGLDCVLNTSSASWEFDEKGLIKHGVSCANHNQVNFFPNFSPSFDQCKPSTPTRDPSSQPLRDAVDVQPLRHAEVACITSTDLCKEMQVTDKIDNFSLPAQASEGACAELDHDRRALAACLEDKGSICPVKKHDSLSDKEIVPEFENIENALSLSEEDKCRDHRIRIIPSPDWLPPGWITEVKTRMAGSTAGATDKYYKDPVTGRRFRSKNEVLSFIQTGRLCRGKPQPNPVEGLTAGPLLLPGVDENLGLENAQTVMARTMLLTSARDCSSQALACQSSYPPNVVLDKINMNITHKPSLHVSSNTCRCLCLNSREERKGSCSVEMNEADNCLSVFPVISSPSMHTETVHMNKRKMADGSVSVASCKRLCRTMEELHSNCKWMICIDQPVREAERQVITTGGELDSAYRSFPGLTCRQHPNCYQDTVNHFNAKYEANTNVCGWYDTSIPRSAPGVHLPCIRELQPRAPPMIKVCEKKPGKVTLKQGRDLLVSLGRQLCVDFLGAAKQSSLQEIESLN